MDADDAAVRPVGDLAHGIEGLIPAGRGGMTVQDAADELGASPGRVALALMAMMLRKPTKADKPEGR